MMLDECDWVAFAVHGIILKHTAFAVFAVDIYMYNRMVASNTHKSSVKFHEYKTQMQSRRVEMQNWENKRIIQSGKIPMSQDSLSKLIIKSRLSYAF